MYTYVPTTTIRNCGVCVATNGSGKVLQCDGGLFLAPAVRTKRYHDTHTRRRIYIYIYLICVYNTYTGVCIYGDMTYYGEPRYLYTAKDPAADGPGSAQCNRVIHCVCAGDTLF